MEEDFIVKTGYNIAAVQLTKYVWRKGYLRLPEHCAAHEHCTASCPEEIYKSRNMSVYDVLIDVNAPQWLASVAHGKLVSRASALVINLRLRFAAFLRD